ncbi:MAG: D-alanine--D-alanine ligase family protein [Chitinivibrionales bacterium]
MGKKRVSVVMGGPSEEHDISLLTGKEIISNMDKQRFVPKAVVLTDELMIYHSDFGYIPSDEELASPGDSDKFKGPVSFLNAESVFSDTEVAFPAMHGAFGEDGKIQGFLDACRIPYTGSGVTGSAIGLNKFASLAIFSFMGLDIPPGIVVTKERFSPDLVFENLDMPVFVKCPQSGSSKLMGRAEDYKELESLIKELSNHTFHFIIEEEVMGEEYSCAVLEYPDGRVEALPPARIIPEKSHFFDYEAKYTENGAQEIVPAPCSQDLTEAIKDTAVKAHNALDLSGISRTDMIHEDGILYVLETNSMPGLSKASIVPRCFRALGRDFSDLITILIDTAERKHHGNNTRN